MLLLGEGQIRISEEQIENIKEKWGLNEPYYKQYLIWAGNLLRGDFGDSLIRTGVPVREMIFEAIPVTARLNSLCAALSWASPSPSALGPCCARTRSLDYSTSVGSALGIAMPNFWFGLMLIVIFSLLLRWLPPFGLRSWQGYIMPVIVLATEQMAVLARVMRSSTMEVMTQDYVKTAHAKGLNAPHGDLAPRRAQCAAAHRHRGGLPDCLSAQWNHRGGDGLCVAGHLGVSLRMQSFGSDYQVVQSLVVLLAVLVVAANLVTDLVYTLVDPRIHFDES